MHNNIKYNQHTVFRGVTIKIRSIRQNARVVSECVICILANGHGHAGSESVRCHWIASSQTELEKINKAAI